MGIKETTLLKQTLTLQHVHKHKERVQVETYVYNQVMLAQTVVNTIVHVMNNVVKHRLGKSNHVCVAYFHDMWRMTTTWSGGLYNILH